MAYDQWGSTQEVPTPGDISEPDTGPVSKKPKVTKDDVILARISSGDTFMRPHISKALRAGNRYLDSSARTLQTNRNIDGETRDLPVGEINYIAMNIRQKVAGIAIGAPDVVIKLKDDAPGEFADIVRKYLRESWIKKRWGRVLRRVLTQRFVGGMGYCAYLWDRKLGFDVEFIETKDVCFDPTTTQDNWDRPRWAARYVNLPREVAEARYGVRFFEGTNASEGDTIGVESPYINATKEKSTFRVACYFDETCEVEAYEGKVLRKGPNRYGRVPFKVMIGEINPNGEFPLGDFDTSLGTFEMMRRLQNIINNTAQNGGGIPWLRSEYIDEKIRQKVINGTHNGYVLVTGVPGDQAVGYTPNNPLNDAVLKAMQMMSQGLDADQGVSEYDRGVVDSNPKFATQAALLANRAGSRGNLARIEYEQYAEDILNEMVKLTVQFGMDPDNEQTDEAQILWEACSAVTEVRIIEESSAFKDPSMVQQQNLQLYQLAVSTFPVMAQIGSPVNLKALFDDLLRSFDKRDVDKYYLSQSEQLALQQQQMAAQMQQTGAAPGAEGQPQGAVNQAAPQGPIPGRSDGILTQ